MLEAQSTREGLLPFGSIVTPTDGSQAFEQEILVARTQVVESPKLICGGAPIRAFDLLLLQASSDLLRESQHVVSIKY